MLKILLIWGYVNEICTNNYSNIVSYNTKEIYCAIPKYLLLNYETENINTCGIP